MALWHVCSDKKYFGLHSEQIPSASYFWHPGICAWTDMHWVP